MAAVFAFGKRGANNRAPVSNYLISKGFDFDGVKVGLGEELRLAALPLDQERHPGVVILHDNKSRCRRSV